MKKIKHNKLKNTGILFELLVRQITQEILSGDSNERAKSIVREFFTHNSELIKELRLYDLLTKEKYNSESRAEKFIDTVLESHKKIKADKLASEKYNLVKRINECYGIDTFLSSPISNYKLLASVYKILESKNQTNADIKDVFDSRTTIVENIISKPSKVREQQIVENSQLVADYRKQDADVRLLTYKILVETFNKKYDKLDSKQKQLLKEYINNVSNTSKFKDYVQAEIPNIVKQLGSINSKIKDKITKIKLTETINVLNNAKIGKVVSDGHVSALMLSYQLIKELKNNIK